MATKRYEFTQGSAYKFWEIERDGTDVTTRWGRIGSDGSEKTKSYSDDEKAQKEYDKLIRSKTKKGYRLVGGPSKSKTKKKKKTKKKAKKKVRAAQGARATGTVVRKKVKKKAVKKKAKKKAKKTKRKSVRARAAGVPESWRALVEADDFAKAFEKHFQPLAETAECKGLLRDIAKVAKGAEVDGKVLKVEFEVFDKPGYLICGMPAKDEDVEGHDFPASYVAALRLHNGYSFPEEGWSSNLNASRGGALMTGFEGYDEGSNEAGLDDDEIAMLECPIDNYSDWVLFHPKHQTPAGEPALGWFYHGSCELEDPENASFGAPGFFLRLIGYRVLEGDPRCKGYVS